MGSKVKIGLGAALFGIALLIASGVYLGKEDYAVGGGLAGGGLLLLIIGGKLIFTPAGYKSKGQSRKDDEFTSFMRDT
jgi:hypothetical protein